MDFVAIDFETANPKRNSACAVGITQVRDGVIGESFYSLIRPAGMEFSHWNTRVHGIRESDVVNAPSLRELWPTLLSIIDGRLLVAHNAEFDMSVLRESLQVEGVPIPNVNYLCSCTLSRGVWPFLPNHKLSTICEFLSISLDHHHAGSDAHATASLVIAGGKQVRVSSIRELARRCRVSLGELFAGGSRVLCEPKNELPVTQSRSNVELIFEDVPRPRRRRPNGENPQVCFSGFSDAEKESLSNSANSKGYATVTSVTVKLAILVTGPNGAGPSKMKKAEAQGCRILNAPEFLALINSSPLE